MWNDQNWPVTHKNLPETHQKLNIVFNGWLPARSGQF